MVRIVPERPCKVLPLGSGAKKISEIRICYLFQGPPQEHLQGSQQSARGTSQIQDIVILTAKTYYRERMPKKIKKGRGARVKSMGDQAALRGCALFLQQ